MTGNISEQWQMSYIILFRSNNAKVAHYKSQKACANLRLQVVFNALSAAKSASKRGRANLGGTYGRLAFSSSSITGLRHSLSSWSCWAVELWWAAIRFTGCFLFWEERMKGGGVSPLLLISTFFKNLLFRTYTVYSIEDPLYTFLFKRIAVWICHHAGILLLCYRKWKAVIIQIKCISLLHFNATLLQGAESCVHGFFPF